MVNQTGHVPSSEINDVLGCAFEFEHFVVSSGFEPSSFKLVSNLDFLVVLAFVVKVVFKFHDEFNRFYKSVHDELLGSKGLDLGDFEALFLLSKLCEDVLLLSLKFDFLNTRLLLLFRSENFGEKTLFTVGLGTSRDDFNNTLSDFFLQAVVLNEHGFVNLLQIADFQTSVGQLVGRGVVNSSTQQRKIGVLLCHPNPPDKLRRADTPKKSLSPFC